MEQENESERPALTPEQIEQMKRIDLLNLQKKVSEGRVLTASEMKRLEEASRAGQAIEPEVSNDYSGPEWVADQTDLAKALGLKNRKTIQRWLKEEGNPGKTSDGKYHVPSWIAFADKNGRKKPSAAPAKADAEVEKLLLQNRKLAAEVGEAEGRLIDVEEVCAIVTQMFNAAAQRLLGARHSLAPHVVGVSIPEATKRLNVVHTDVLADMAVVPEWAKKKAHPQGLFWRNVSVRLSGLLQIDVHGSGLSGTS